jgi:putative ABC transport system permease protein
MGNIFKSTVRNFIRKPATNLINLLGLSVSLALVIMLSVYCYSELTTDSHHKNRDRVYIYGLNELDDRIYTPGILKEHIDANVPGIESVVRISGTWEAPVFQVENNDPITSDLIFADEDFFLLFTYNFIEGNSETAITDPMSVVITQSLARRLFGDEIALGKIIKLNNTHNLTVSAVVEEPKVNTCLAFNALASIATRKIVQEADGEYTEWGWSDFQTFLLLKDGVDPGTTEKTILALFPLEMQKDYRNAKLTPLKKIYFSKFLLFGSSYLVSGDKNKVQILIFVVSLVLMIALVNFVNISSSQWIDKIKQTGVLKVIGASRTTILKNVLFEAFLMFLLSLLIAITLVFTFYYFISNYTGIYFNFQLLYLPSFYLVAVIGTFILSIIFSLIPAIRISSSRVVYNLKNTVDSHQSNSMLRGVLVTTQFIIAIVLIAFTILVQKQVNFGSSNLGFDQNNIISIELSRQLNHKKDVFKSLLEENPTVKKVSFSQFYPGKINSSRDTELTINGEKKLISFDLISADTEFFEILDLQLVSGRLYSDTLSSDMRKMVVNEAFLRENKVTNPLGGTVIMGSSYEIIGVIKDFHFKPVNQPIIPLAIRNDPNASYCHINIQTNDFKSLSATVNNIKKTATELSPSFPVEITFFDQAIENMYQSELQFRRTFSLFAGCAIVICCLGILAMSLFACQRRIKEIGIRKVNGARVPEVMTMLNRDFVKWVVIAFVIATPIAWYAMNKWLENFAYKTSLSWWIFALAGLMALGIALLTVSWQSWKAATRNPVEALRYE